MFAHSTNVGTKSQRLAGAALGERSKQDQQLEREEELAPCERSHVGRAGNASHHDAVDRVVNGAKSHCHAKSGPPEPGASVTNPEQEPGGSQPRQGGKHHQAPIATCSALARLAVSSPAVTGTRLLTSVVNCRVTPLEKPGMFTQGLPFPCRRRVRPQRRGLFGDQLDRS